MRQILFYYHSTASVWKKVNVFITQQGKIEKDNDQRKEGREEEEREERRNNKKGEKEDNCRGLTSIKISLGLPGMLLKLIGAFCDINAPLESHFLRWI